MSMAPCRIVRIEIGFAVSVTAVRWLCTPSPGVPARISATCPDTSGAAIEVPDQIA